MAESDTLTKVLAWVALIIGIIILAVGGLSLLGVVSPWIVRVFGGITAIVLGAFLAYWGVEKLRGEKDPVKKAKRTLLEASEAGKRGFESMRAAAMEKEV